MVQSKKLQLHISRRGHGVGLAWVSSDWWDNGDRERTSIDQVDSMQMHPASLKYISLIAFGNFPRPYQVGDVLVSKLVGV